MKKFISSSILAVMLTVAALSICGVALAEEIKMVGTITRLEIAKDGKSANVTLKDTKSGAEVPIVITDDLTLDKFKDKRIVVDDEIRCKYDNESGRNVSKMFKKTAGC